MALTVLFSWYWIQFWEHMWAELEKNASLRYSSKKWDSTVFNKWLKEILMYDRQKYCWTQSVSRRTIFTSCHRLPGYLSGVENNPTWGKAGVRGENGENAHYYCIYHFRTEKVGKRVYFHIKKGMSHLDTFHGVDENSLQANCSLFSPRCFLIWIIILT